MDNFDPDAFLSGTSRVEFDPDAFLASDGISSVNEDVPPSGRFHEPIPEKPKQNTEPKAISDTAIGLGETALAAITGATTGALGFLGGTAEGIIKEATGEIEKGEAENIAIERAASATFSPRTEKGQEFTKALSETLGFLPPVLGTTPLVSLKTAIPNRNIPKEILNSKKAKSNLLKREIAEGNPNIETIAKALNSNGEVVDLPASKAAIKTLGGGERTVELVSVLERLDPASKRGALKAIQDIETGIKYPDRANELRPSFVVGDTIAKRGQAIAVKNQQAGERIGNIANSLKNKDVNIQTPVNDFFSKLDRLGVTFSRGDDGWVTPDFSRSTFKGGNQKDLTVMVNKLLADDVKFLDAHKLKQEIRDGLSYDVGGAGQLKGQSEKLLRDLSRDINSVLTAESKPYEKANKQFSSTVEIKDKFQKLAGKDIDLFDDLASEALAGKARRIASNAESRTSIIKTINDADKVLGDFGVHFKDNISTLSFVTNRLEEMFKLRPDNSAQGIVEKGVGAAIDSSLSPLSVAKQGLTKLTEASEKSNKEKLNAIKAVLKQ